LSLFNVLRLRWAVARNTEIGLREPEDGLRADRQRSVTTDHPALLGAPVCGSRHFRRLTLIDLEFTRPDGATHTSALTYDKERLACSMIRHMDGTWRKSRRNRRKNQWRRRESNPIFGAGKT
jgi:hypothetical protein